MPDPRISVILGAQDQASKVVTGLRGQFARFGQDAKAGFGLGAGFSAFNAFTKVAGFVTDALGDAQRAASSMAEQQSKLDQVFDTSADTIRAWSEDSASAMGLSQRAALENAGTLGNFLQAMGTAEGASADMSMTLVQLAGDLASFNNTAGGAEEVLIALSAGLRGETEPMTRFGVDVSAAAVQARLLADGVEKVGGAFTQAQKIEARYALIMEKTVKAQGNFVLTAGGSANQARELASRTENLNAKMGVLVDQTVIAAQGLAIDLVEGIEAVGVAFGDLMRLFDPAGAEIESVDKAILGLAEAAGVNAEAVIAYAKTQREQTAETDRAIEVERRITEALELHRQGYVNLGMAQADIDAAMVQIEAQLRGTIVAVEGLGVAQSDAADKARVLITEFNALTFAEKLAFRATEDLGGAADAAGEGLGGLGGGADKAAAESAALDAALRTVAAGGLKEARQESRKLERQWDRMIGGPDRNRQAIRKLREELGRWQRRYKRAVDANDSEAAAFALTQSQRVEDELADRELVVQSLKDVKAAADAIPNKVGVTVTTPGLDGAIADMNAFRYAAIAAITKGRAAANMPPPPTGGGPPPGFGGASREKHLRRGKRHDGASGATYFPGDWGMVGERGAEHIRNVGGAAVVSPMAGGGGGGHGGAALPPINVYVDGHKLFEIMDRRGGDSYSLTRTGDHYRSAG